MFNFSLVLTLHEPFFESLNHLDWKALENHYDYLILRFFFGGKDPLENTLKPTVTLSGTPDSLNNVLVLTKSAGIPNSKVLVGIPTFNLKLEIFEADNVTHSSEISNPPYTQVISGKTLTKTILNPITQNTSTKPGYSKFSVQLKFLPLLENILHSESA